MAHLHLVTDTPRPRTPRPKLRLTRGQRERLGTALRSLHRMYGTWAGVADDMGCTPDALKGVFTGRCGSMAMVVAAAGLLRIPVERLLSTSVADSEHCPTCGQKLPSVTRSTCPSVSPQPTPSD
jgi:hypothetical protein